MHGLLRSMKTAELPNYSGNVMKGIVTGLGRNSLGLYLFDIACVRAPSHGPIPELTGMAERQVALPGRDGREYGILNIRFESVINASKNEPLKIEMTAYDNLPRRSRLEEVADSLWQVVNQSLAIDALYMVASVSLDEEVEPRRRWARTHDSQGTIVPASVIEMQQFFEGSNA